jgi:hypothetical protein
MTEINNRSIIFPLCYSYVRADSTHPDILLRWARQNKSFNIVTAKADGSSSITTSSGDTVVGLEKIQKKKRNSFDIKVWNTMLIDLVHELPY